MPRTGCCLARDSVARREQPAARSPAAAMADAKSKSYVTKVVSTMLGESAKLVDDSMADDLVTQFLEGKVVDGKRVDKLLFFAQDGTVICTSGDSEPLKGKGAFVVRVTDDGKPVSVPENDINFGTINGEDSTTTLQTLTKLMSEVYDPCLASNLFGYVKKMKPNEKEELEGLQKKCVVVIDKAISSLQGGLELAKPDPSDSSLQVRASAVGSVGRREGGGGFVWRAGPFTPHMSCTAQHICSLPPRSKTSLRRSKLPRRIRTWWPSWRPS